MGLQSILTTRIHIIVIVIQDTPKDASNSGGETLGSSSQTPWTCPENFELIEIINAIYILNTPHTFLSVFYFMLKCIQEIVRFMPTHLFIILGERMGLCREEVENECSNSASGEYSIVPPLLVFLSQFILGVGTTLYYSLGQTYIDDNTKKKNTPLLLGKRMLTRTCI